MLDKSLSVSSSPEEIKSFLTTLQCPADQNHLGVRVCLWSKEEAKAVKSFTGLFLLQVAAITDSLGSSKLELRVGGLKSAWIPFDYIKSKYFFGDWAKPLTSQRSLNKLLKGLSGPLVLKRLLGSAGRLWGLHCSGRNPHSVLDSSSSPGSLSIRHWDAPSPSLSGLSISVVSRAGG